MMFAPCPECGDTHIISFSSTRTAICSGCGLKMNWPLKENQKPLVSSNRDTRKPPNGK